VIVVDVARQQRGIPAVFDELTPRVGAATVQDARDDPRPVSAIDAAEGAFVATTTTAPPVTTTAVTPPAVELPVPRPLPADPYEDAPEEVVGRITIPAIGLDQPLQSGMSLTAINRGPSHWPGTAMPGQLGNVVVAGHRTTYTRPFGALDRLRPGDQVVYRTAAGEFTYAVTGTEVVEPSALDIADQTAAYTATLFACHPPGSARFRIVVKMAMVDGSGGFVPAPRVTVANQAATTAFRA
jgi:sortase A